MTMTTFELTVNGRTLLVEREKPTTTLLQFLRTRGMTGTKEGCAEGDCGACSVALVDRNASGQPTFRAINACIALLPMFAGREIVTVEGLSRNPDRDAPLSLADLHPVQRAMVENYGSQCGFCTPGFVMSMFEGYYREDLAEPWQMTDQLCGNLCRCTGYRPIREAMQDAMTHAKTSPHRSTDAFVKLLAKKREKAPLDYRASDERFVTPTSLTELLTFVANHPDAVLVAGATEIGVYQNKRYQHFPLLVSTEGVAELRAIRKTDEAFVVGAAATLTELEEAIEGELAPLKKMLLVFASRQIRNRATLAGNLVTASPIGDMAPVLLALGAEITLASHAASRTMPLDEFFLGYRKTALAPGEIVTSITIPRAIPSGLSRRFETYKVSKRRELDISIVAAAFAVCTDDHDVIRNARLAYGGVAATPARAKEAERALVGKTWHEAFATAKPLLEKAFSPLSDVRSGDAYRRGLVVDLFEKFTLGVTSEAQDAPLGFDRTRDFDAGTKVTTEKALSHDSAIGHVTGSAKYVDDVAVSRPMLEIWPITAKVARGRILKRDASAALAMPGVAAVLLAEDVPGENDVGAVRKDEPLFAKDEVLFHGQIIGAVVADTYENARKAAAAVVVEVEPLAPILTIEDAIEKGSFHTEPHTIARGDAASALAQSPMRASGSLHIGGQEHFYLEAHAAWAERGEDGELFVSSSTQHPSEVQAVVSHVLHMPRHKITVQSPRMGGGFGGKETQGNAWASIVALAAWKTGKPARVMLDRDVDMMVTGKRHPFFARYDVGFDRDGHILAVGAQLVSDGGWALDLSHSILDRALFHFDNAYYLPNVSVTGRVAKTNNVSHTAFRGFGGPQGMVVIEEVLARVAKETGLLPEEVRRRNLYRGDGETNTTHYGQPIGDDRIERIWNELSESSELAKRRREIAAWNASSPHVKRGIAMTPVKFGISFTASFLNQAGALVLVYRDGSVQVNHGGTEMGQGLYAKMQGVAMRELGLPAGSVRVMRTQTDKVPNTSATAASSGADLNGAAVKDACDQLRARLLPIAVKAIEKAHGVVVSESELVFQDARVFAASRPEECVSFARVVEDAYFARVQLSAAGFYSTPNLHYDAAKGRGKPFHYFASGASVSEVEVDGLSGMKRILRVDVLHDVGETLNASIDRGQIEGGFVQGAGWLTGEELKWDAAGKLLSHSASTYQIPAISDAPVDFRVNLLSRAHQSNTVHGSKAVGEPPLMLALSVREALRDAVNAFGGSNDLGCPATHEALWTAIQLK